MDKKSRTPGDCRVEGLNESLVIWFNESGISRGYCLDTNFGPLQLTFATESRNQGQREGEKGRDHTQQQLHWNLGATRRAVSASIVLADGPPLSNPLPQQLWVYHLMKIVVHVLFPSAWQGLAGGRVGGVQRSMLYLMLGLFLS